MKERKIPHFSSVLWVVDVPKMDHKWYGLVQSMKGPTSLGPDDNPVTPREAVATTPQVAGTRLACSTATLVSDWLVGKSLRACHWLLGNQYTPVIGCLETVSCLPIIGWLQKRRWLLNCCSKWFLFVIGCLELDFSHDVTMTAMTSLTDTKIASLRWTAILQDAISLNTVSCNCHWLLQKANSVSQWLFRTVPRLWLAVQNRSSPVIGWESDLALWYFGLEFNLIVIFWWKDKHIGKWHIPISTKFSWRVEV